MNKPMTCALIGAGEFGNFAESVLDQVPGIQLAAVVDTNEAAAQRLASTYNVPIYKSVDDLLKNKTVDFVMINTPNDTHYALAKAVLKHGIGVFCEKPLVIDSPQISELFSLAKPGQLDVDMVLRESKGYQYLKTLTEDMSPPKRIHLENHAHEATIQAEWYWSDVRSGGWFYTSAIHFVDIFIFLWPDLQFDQYRAWLDVDPINGRTRGYEFGLKGPEIEISVLHRFDTVGPEHLGAEFDFGQSKARLTGWVPTEITWNTKKLPSFHLGYDREVEYRGMVARRLTGFLGGFRHQQWRVTQAEVLNVSQWCERLGEVAKRPRQWQDVVT